MMKLTMVIRQGDEQKELPLEAESIEQAHEMAQKQLPQGAELVGIYDAEAQPDDG